MITQPTPSQTEQRRARRWWLARCVWLVGILPLLVLLLPRLQLTAAADAPTTFQVIVNPNNPMTSVDADFVVHVFLKKTTRWPDGEAIQPVDLRPDSVTRDEFSGNVLRRSIAAIRNYWQQRIFSGRDVPPPELESDAAVVRFVNSAKGGIGYVAAGTPIGRAKALIVK